MPVCTNLEKHYYPWTILHWWWWTTFLRRGMCGFGSSFLPYFVTFCYAFPTIVLLRDALATCDQIHYTKVIEYIQNVPLTEVWIEPETSCIKLQCNTAYTKLTLLVSDFNGSELAMIIRPVEGSPKKKWILWLFGRTFGSSQTSTYGKSSEHKNQRVWSLIIKLVTFVRISVIAYPKVGQNERTRVRESLPIGPHLP